VALDATPKGINANSYATYARANTILTTEWLNATAWAAATQAKAESALIMATFLMDATFEYDGSKRTVEQALRLPRSGLVDQDGNNIDMDTIPKLAEKACAVFANELLASNRLEDPALLGLGISSATLGPLSVTIDKTQLKSLVPKDVIIILAPIAGLDPIAGYGMRMSKLTRA